ncbi:MAG: hypothetical protein WC295_02810 [Methanoregula sp.]|jgi:hypothetical protein
MLDDMIYKLTKGRPFIFIAMKYNSKERIHEIIKSAVEKEFGMACIRADDVKSAGFDLLAKIQKLIERAEIVIADISVDSPNVFYEIGYAVGKDKSPIILVDSKRKKKVPVDLQGLEVLRYEDIWDGEIPFIRELNSHLGFRLKSSNALLRDMLIPEVLEEIYIVASPKYPNSESPFAGQVRDIRTFGDYLGVMGILTAFGSTMGESKAIQLVSGQYSSDDLLTRPASLFMIGSRKSNPPAGKMMAKVLKGKDPYWTFDPAGDVPEKGDWRVMLYKHLKGEKLPQKGTVGTFQDKQIWKEDYGIIIRAPHPLHPDRLVLIMAGAHSLGTGAACIAATYSPCIKEIQKFLPEKVLGDKSKSFWVLVKGKASENDGLLDQENVEIIDSGVYD